MDPLQVRSARQHGGSDLEAGPLPAVAVRVRQGTGRVQQARDPVGPSKCILGEGSLGLHHGLDGRATVLAVAILDHEVDPLSHQGGDLGGERGDLGVQRLPLFAGWSGDVLRIVARVPAAVAVADLDVGNVERIRGILPWFPVTFKPAAAGGFDGDHAPLGLDHRGRDRHGDLLMAMSWLVIGGWGG